MAGKLGIEVTPDLLKLDDNEAITNALVEIATQAGKSEDEIAAALGWEKSQIDKIKLTKYLSKFWKNIW